MHTGAIHLVCHMLLLLYAAVHCNLQPAEAHRTNGPQKLVVIMVDGFRWDYYDTHKDHLPAFQSFLENGVRAEWVEPVFPTVSYTNWHTLSTGLYPESHGILGNSMYDPNETDPELMSFSLSKPNSTMAPKWWQEAEPIWITATKNGKSTWLRHWSRCDVPYQGHLASECVGYGPEKDMYDAKLTLELIPSKLAEGFDLAMVHVDFLDHAGHENGPFGTEVKEALVTLDGFLGALMDELAMQGLYNQTNVIITSDHGMTYTGAGSGVRYINLDEHVNMSEIKTTVGSGAHMQIVPVDGFRMSVYQALSKVDSLHVFLREDIPTEWYYKHGRYTQDILVVPKEGFLLRQSASSKKPGGGSHGYPPTMTDMRAIFFASGPAFKRSFIGKPIRAVDIYQLYTEILHIPPQPHNGTWENVEPFLAYSSIGSRARTGAQDWSSLVYSHALDAIKERKCHTQDISRRERGVLVSWGRPAGSGKSTHGGLLASKISLMSAKRCKRYVSKVTAGNICAELSPAEQCLSDFGGTLLASFDSYTTAQIGTLSYLKGNCSNGVAVFTKVCEYRGWMKRRTSGCGNYELYGGDS